jgi:hypothetical protein
MKKILMAAVALTAMATVPATPAAAADFTVTGSVAAACNYTGGTIAFGAIGTNADGTIAASQSTSSSAQTGFFCNGAGTTLALSHTAMANAATPASGFTSTIDYTPAVSVGGVDQQLGDGNNNTFGAQAGDLVVDARTLTATGKLMAGNYSGTITLTLTPL